MSVTGLCQICEQNDAEHSCPNCGTLACEKHWDEATGLCAQCAAAVERGGGDESAVRPDDLDDDEVMRF
ncbi:hypothetical protein [Halorussus sp. MSC15.2]|uniref:hypothetical protein n=1 Tax=Halorussus sp. MSC15.2 TaxID=2283638 RepID=UPI0013CFF342|nr:hypothetical protein [Halorussus sp. MSC15.2]NEU55844.1 hypothetical protein [Halorussus sp. MSC15.2]